MSKLLLKRILRNIHFYHKHHDKKDIFIFSTPRSGSTLLLDMISTQPAIKIVNEPLSSINIKTYSNIKNIQPTYIKLDESDAKHMNIYFQNLLEGRTINSMRYSDILSPYHSFFPNRSTVKILRGGHLINFFRNHFDFYTVGLVRHPIPTSLSNIRNNWNDTINVFLQSEQFKKQYLGKNLVKFITQKLNSGSNLEKFSISWCLENKPIIHHCTTNGILISYEEMLTNSREIINLLSEKLKLEKPQRMLDIMTKPSYSSNHSTKTTNQHIMSHDIDFLLKKWKKSISPQAEKKVFDILDRFHIDMYEYDNFSPSKPYLLSHS